MALFRCLVVGENFPGVLAGLQENVGFYATRFVEAPSETEAETKVLELLRSDEALDAPLDVRSATARVYFEQIHEVADDTERAPNGGFTFFPMGT